MLDGLQSDARDKVRRGHLQHALTERLGSAFAHSQATEAIISQYKVTILTPQLQSPATAAGAFFLGQLDGLRQAEKRRAVSLYRQFPYNPTVRR